MMCVICHKEIEPDRDDDGKIYWTEGNDARPVGDGRCCNKCNLNIVLPMRYDEIILKEMEDKNEQI